MEVRTSLRLFRTYHLPLLSINDVFETVANLCALPCSPITFSLPIISHPKVMVTSTTAERYVSAWS